MCGGVALAEWVGAGKEGEATEDVVEGEECGCGGWPGLKPGYGGGGCGLLEPGPLEDIMVEEVTQQRDGLAGWKTRHEIPLIVRKAQCFFCRLSLP